MENDVAIVGLMHLGTLAIAISIAYVGLDRVGASLGGGRAFDEKIYLTQARIEEFLLRFDIRPGRDDRSILPDTFHLPELYVLCDVAGIDLKPRGFGFVVSLIQRLRYTPFLWYFRRRRDLVVGYLLLVLSMLAYLFFVAHMIWSFPPLNEHVEIVILYWLFTGTIIVIAANMVVASRLARLEQISDRLMHLIDWRIREVTGTMMDNLASNLKRDALPRTNDAE